MFLDPEPWTEQFFEPVNNLTDKVIPIDDTTALKLFPGHRWAYNKMNLCDSQNIPNGLEGTPWSITPAISKPISSVWGMSSGVKHLDFTWEYFDDALIHYRAGNFWMPYFEGHHFSTDFVLLDGKIQWYITFEGRPYKDIGTFSYWKIVKLPKNIYQFIETWLKIYIGKYTGIVNIESINDHIIECHLRLSPQFVDLYCPTTNWLVAVSRLYSENRWHYNFPKPTKGYSVVLWTDKPGMYTVNEKALHDANLMVESVVMTFRPEHDIVEQVGANKHFRLAVANGWSFKSCNNALSFLKPHIKKVG